MTNDRIEKAVGLFKSGYNCSQSVVAVENRLVPRTAWDGYALAEGMNIVIIKAACGG